MVAHHPHLSAGRRAYPFQRCRLAAVEQLGQRTDRRHEIKSRPRAPRPAGGGLGPSSKDRADSVAVPSPTSHYVVPPSTLAHGLADRADRHGERLAISFRTGGGRWSPLSYAQLWQRAAAVADALRPVRRRVSEPRFVLIVLPNGLEYVASFYGCLIAGAVAVPFYPPTIMSSRAARAFQQRLGQI